MKKQNKYEELFNYCHSLFDVHSKSKRDKMLRNADGFLTALLVQKHKPELLTQSDSDRIKGIKEKLDEKEKDLLAEIFMAKYLGITMEAPDYTMEAIKDLYAKGLYFTETEIDDIINWQLSRPVDDIDVEVICYLIDCHNNHLYFDTIEEADKAMEEYENKNMKMSYKEALSHLASLDKDSLPRSSDSCSTSPSTISLS